MLGLRALVILISARLTAPDQRGDMPRTLTRRRAESFQGLAYREVVVPKKKLPTTLKLTFQERREGYRLSNGEPLRYMAAIQFLLGRFFAKPLTLRLEELSGRVEKSDTDLAERIRSIKTGIEQQEAEKRRIEETRKIKIIFQESDHLAPLVDEATEVRFLRAVEGMLDYLMVEAMYTETALPFDMVTRQAAGLNEKPGRKKVILASLRACLRDNALHDFLGVRVGGVRNENKNPDWTEENKASLAQLHNGWGTKLDQLVDCVIGIIRANNYDANSLSIVEARSELRKLKKELVVSDKDDIIFKPALAGLVEDVLKRNGRRQTRDLSPEGLKLRFKARLVNPSAPLPSLSSLKRYQTQGQDKSIL